MANVYCKSGAGAAEFAQLHAYSLGDKIVIKRVDAGTNFAIARRWVWECTTAGTSAAAEPTWPASVTQDTTTITSGGATFTARRPGYSSGTTPDWSFATIYLDYASVALVANGETVFVSHQHSENPGTAPSIQPATTYTGWKCVCVNDGAAPPTAVATGAVVTTTGALDITTGGSNNGYFYGIKFVAGATDTGTRSIVTSTGYFENCAFEIASSGASSTITSNAAYWKNCTVKFAAAGQTITVSSGKLNWNGGGLAVGSTSPTALIGSGMLLVYLDNLDLSQAAAAMNLTAANVTSALAIRNCKMPTSWSGTIGTAQTAVYGPAYSMGTYNCIDGTLNYGFLRKTAYGSVTYEATKVKSGGATDGTTALSWKLDTLATAGVGFPNTAAHTQEIVKWQETVGNPITVSVDILHDSLTKLKDDEVWLEVMYLSAANSTLGATVSSAKATQLTTAADVAASSATWTTTGLTNPNKQKLSVTFTPQLKGFIFARVFVNKASYTVYIDPKLIIS